jgi:hypothetical protein
VNQPHKVLNAIFNVPKLQSNSHQQVAQPAIFQPNVKTKFTDPTTLFLSMKQLLLVFVLLLGGLMLHAQQSNTTKPELSVFPNPAIDNISVHDNSEVVTQVLVFNLVGKKVKTFEHLKGEYHYVGDLPKGVYLVQMIDKGKRILTTQKIDKR